MIFRKSSKSWSSLLPLNKDEIRFPRPAVSHSASSSLKSALSSGGSNRRPSSPPNRDWPASGTYYATGTLVNLTATANTGFAFSNWTGSVANANSASTTVTMSAPKSVTANLTPNGPTTTSLVSSTNPSHVRPPPGAVTLPLPGFEQHGQQIAGAATNSSTRRRAAHR